MMGGCFLFLNLKREFIFVVWIGNYTLTIIVNCFRAQRECERSEQILFWPQARCEHSEQILSNAKI